MKSELIKPLTTNFSKGLSFAASHLIDPEECQVTDNFLFGDGTATVRQGTQLYGNVPSPVAAMCRHYNKDGTAYLLAVAGGQCYVSYTSGVFTPVSSDPISGVISVSPYDDFVYLTSYPGTVKYFDGSSMNVAGISSPTLQSLIGDFTTCSSWNLAYGSGTLANDTNQTHLGIGNAALQITTAAGFGSPGFVEATQASYQDLTHFADVSSDNNDLITIMTTHKSKAAINLAQLGFQTFSGDTAVATITNLSSWVGCSSDGWTLNHTIPKAVASSWTYAYTNYSGFTASGYIASGAPFLVTTLSSTLVSGTIMSGAITSGSWLSGTVFSGTTLELITASGTFVSGKVVSGYLTYLSGPGYIYTQASTYVTPGFVTTSNFVWSSCYPFVYLGANRLYGQYAQAQITFSYCKMVKTPPITNPLIAPYGPTLFFGSANSNVTRFFTDPQTYELQLEGSLTLNAPLPDGTVFYKTTFAKQGPTGLQIESNASQQSSGLAISTSISTVIISASGTPMSAVVYIGTYFGLASHYNSPFYGPGPISSVQYTDISTMILNGQLPNVWIDPGTQKAVSPPVSGSYGIISISGGAVAAQVLASGATLSSVVFMHYPKLTDIPIAPASFACNARNIYRREATAPAFQYVYQVGDNTTTTFIDNVPSAVLGDAQADNNDPPPIAKYVYSAANQQTYYLNITEGGVAYPSRVRFSNPYTPYYAPLNNVFDVNPGDGTQLTGMFEFANLQFLLKERSTWLLDPSTGNPSQMHHIYGCIAPNSIAVGPQVVFWLSDDGIIEFNLNLINISQGKAKINNFLKALPKQNLAIAAGAYFNSYYLLAVDTDGTGSNDTVIVYDTVSGEWSKFPNINVNCWSVWGGSQDGSRLFYGNNSGQVCEFLVGNDDMGTPIPWTIQTKDFGAMTPQEAYRDMFLFTKDLDGNSRTIQAVPFYDMTATSSDTDYIDTSGYTSGIGLGKLSFNPKDGTSFFSLQFSSSGRVQVVRLDAYAKQESVR